MAEEEKEPKPQEQPKIQDASATEYAKKLAQLLMQWRDPKIPSQTTTIGIKG